MNITRKLSVPTGDILVVEGQHGLLELLSLGDYGKDVNLKCQAMGLSRDFTHVAHTKLLPLEDKWVITISTQYGCREHCKFCDVPRVGPGKNATKQDLIDQVLTGLAVHPEVKATKRLNIHFARMGEPTFNPAVLEATEWLADNLPYEYYLHPVVSTMMPRNNEWLKPFIHAWMHIKNELLSGEAGLQLSINSTNEGQRSEMFNEGALSLEEIAEVMDGVVPVLRKITLNFAVANYEINPDVLLKYFDPANYIIKLTPMHKTKTAIANNIASAIPNDYTTLVSYKEHEDALIRAGYEVLIFIASFEEDMGRITCGNAILSGSLPECKYWESNGN